MTRTASALLLTLAAASAVAQTTVGPEFRVNEHTTGDQLLAAVAADAAGNFVVVWTSYGQDGGGPGVFGRRFGPDGSPRGGEFQVNTFTTNQQWFPDVASDAAGNFAVVWESLSQGAIVGRRYDANGTPGPEFMVDSYATGVQVNPSVAFAANGGFVVVWQSYGQSGVHSGIFGQRFDAAGNRLGAEFEVNTYTTGGEYSPALAAAPSGDFVVVWESDTQEGYPNYGIFGQRFDAAGQRVGGEFHVNTVTAGQQARPAVAIDRAGSFTVSWFGPDASVNGIWGQRYDAHGAPLGGEFPLNSVVTGSQFVPEMAIDANGNTVVSWSGSIAADSSGVAARRFDCDFQPQGPEVPVNTYTTGSQGSAAVAALPGGFVVVWRSDAQDGSNGGIYAQRFQGQPACGSFHTVEPCRLADTRNPPGPTGGPALGANTSRDFPVGGSCGVPADARAVALNLTAVNPTDLGNLRVHPAREPVPLASALNFVPGRTRANNAVTPLGTDGKIAVRVDMPVGSTGATHLVVDVYGYFR